MENSELVNSHEVINGSTTPEQEAAFSEVVERLEAVDLASINDYLNADVPADSDWHDYWDAFSRYEWYQFADAYHHVMSRDFSLD